jgi:hypothetical protein
MAAELVMVVVVISFDGRLFYGVVHSFDLVHWSKDDCLVPVGSSHHRVHARRAVISTGKSPTIPARSPIQKWRTVAANPSTGKRSISASARLDSRRSQELRPN